MSDAYFDATYQTFYLKSTGDYWHNRNELVDFFDNVTDHKKILLHFRYHAFSMESSGLLELIRESAKNKPFLNPNQMLLIHSPNREEDHYGYYNLFGMPVCDQFLKCQNYWTDNSPIIQTDAKRFAHMIGRPTLPRIKLFWDMRKLNIQSECFESMLEDSGPGLWNFPEYHYDQLDDWFTDLGEANEFCNWFNTTTIKSFDKSVLEDQQVSEKTVRHNAVQQSSWWYIDIVFETFTVGNTFAPTEKLIRSLITEKPFIVFAAPDYLQRLQQIGFKTFNTLWDESYDQYQLIDRYQRMLELIRHLATLKKDVFLDLMAQASDIAKYNKKVLENLNIEHHGSKDQWINKVERIT